MSERLTPQERRARDRRRAGKQVAAGLAMTGGAATAQELVSRKVGVASLPKAAREIYHHGYAPKHGKYAAGWLATRGVAAAGVPLAAVGTRNLWQGRQRKDLNVRRDVVGNAVGRTLALPQAAKPATPAERRGRRASAAAGLAATTGGGALGTLAAKKLLRRRSALAVGLGSAVGATGGLVLATAPTRRLTQRASGGQYDYSLEHGPVKVSKLQQSDPAIQTLARREQKELIRRKKKQGKYSLAGAGLGITALGLRSPQLVRAVGRRLPKGARNPVVLRASKIEPAATGASNNLGVVSIGVGSAGSLNFARIQRSETKADERSTKVAKDKWGRTRYQHASRDEVAKALIRIPRIRKAPVKFGRVRTGGFAQIRNQYTGATRTIYRRGSLG